MSIFCLVGIEHPIYYAVGIKRKLTYDTAPIFLRASDSIKFRDLAGKMQLMAISLGFMKKMVTFEFLATKRGL